MIRSNKRALKWTGLILAVLVMLVWPLMPLENARARLDSIPESGNGFRARGMPLTDEDRKLLGDADAVSKAVQLQGGGGFVLTVIDGTRNRHAVHDPSYCFVGSGWEVAEKREVATTSGTALMQVLVKDGRRLEALSFFDDKGRQFSSATRYWLEAGWRRMTFGASGAEPVLVICKGVPDVPVDWDRVRNIVLPAMGFP